MDVIVGGGRFGVEAAKFLEKKGRSYVVVDRNPDCVAVKELKLQKVESVGEVRDGRYFIEGGVEVLPSLLRLEPDYIFPTAPVHVAAEAVRVKFNLKPWNYVLDCIIANLPARVIVSAGRGSVVVSYNRDADCLEKCSAPDVCPVTKLRKPCPMYELVRFAYPEAFILISKQLEPGLGAIEGKDFAELMVQAEKSERIVVATACKCHGVITALTRE